MQHGVQVLSHHVPHIYHIILLYNNIMDVTNINGCRIYVDITTGKNCRQFTLLTWNSLIGQFVRQGEGMG